MPQMSKKTHPIVDGDIYEEHMVDGEVVPCTSCESETLTTVLHQPDTDGEMKKWHVCVFCRCTPAGRSLFFGEFGDAYQDQMVKTIAQGFNLLYWKGR